MDKRSKPFTEKTNKEICLLYLKRYEEKDLNSIEEMFSEDIVLRDWKIRVKGKDNAINETRKNFENANSIEIDVLSTYENKNTVAAELKIVVDSKEELYVVDIITINAEGKIKSIRAYLGRGDN
ncbi:nuclear transport factor 2 family protein [Flagellimonas lutimaris]|uniref:nuclear transport factor 2 family protein n=1 Tax=Flagellimonas lutimaris TaxID=475082 RepID=UPI003F5CEFF7